VCRAIISSPVLVTGGGVANVYKYMILQLGCCLFIPGMYAGGRVCQVCFEMTHTVPVPLTQACACESRAPSSNHFIAIYVIRCLFIQQQIMP
jgi:hypothetical protein